MFDTISISDTLPYTQEMKDLGLDINNHSWQTKDLDNVLSQYFIQGGRLFLQKYKIDNWVNGDPNGKSFLDKLGYLDRKDTYLEPIYHHGEIYFYDSVRDVQDKWDCWIEFKAVFTNGGLDRYTLVKFDKEDNAERIQLYKKFKDEMRERDSKWYNKYLFYTRPYRWFSRKVWYNSCISISGFFNKIAYKL